MKQPTPMSEEEEQELRVLAKHWPSEWDVPRLLATLDAIRLTSQTPFASLRRRPPRKRKKTSKKLCHPHRTC